MKFEAQVRVMPHKVLLDPQGKNSNSITSKRIGLESCSGVRVGKIYRWMSMQKDKAEAESIVKTAYDKILINPIMEYFEFSLTEKNKMLYLVPTPIGNLEDMTYRAVKVLNRVDYILAEDTRTSRRFYNITKSIKPLHSFHDHNEHGKLPMIISDLKSGKEIALVN